MRASKALIRLALVGLVGALIWAVLPGFASHDSGDVLHLSTDESGATQFFHQPGDPDPSDSEPAPDPKVQPLINDKGCTLTSSSLSGPLVQLTPNTADTGRAPSVGYIEGLGIKTGGANGTPCSQVEYSESESLTVTSKTLGWGKAVLDLELKQDGHVKLELLDETGERLDTFELRTGSTIDLQFGAPGTSLPYEATLPNTDPLSTDLKTVNCANPSDSGPDAGPNDNCRLTIDPAFVFHGIRISALSGSVSLEGGSDYLGTELTPSDGESNFDSLFFYEVTPSLVDDLFFACEDLDGTPQDSDGDLAPDTCDTTSVASFGGDVLANDSNTAPGSVSPLTTSDLAYAPSLGSENTGGQFDLTNSGLFTFTPPLNWSGSASFTYEVCNTLIASDCRTASASIVVLPVNDPPIVSAPDGGFVFPATEDVELTLCPGVAPEPPADDTVYFGATDVDTASLLVSVTSGGGGFSDPDPNGCVTYLNPNDDFNGDVTFSYQICENSEEGALCSPETPGTATISVGAVNDAPEAVDDSNGAWVANENQVGAPDTSIDINGSDLVANDTDIDNETSELSFVTASATTETAGSVSVTGGVITYTAPVESDSDVDVTDTFQYTVRDPDGLTDTGTVSVTVRPVMCVDQTKDSTSPSGDVFGAFTLLQSSECKNYSVSATDGDAAEGTEDTVTFVPGGSGEAIFVGTLRFNNAVSPEAVALLEFCPDESCTVDFNTLPVCLTSTYLDSNGDPVDPALVMAGYVDGGDNSGKWCLLSLSAVADQGELVPVYEVYGIGDPLFRAR